MSSLPELLQSIATTIADYRCGEIASPSPQHVDQWAQQFSASTRVAVLHELDHVLKRTYINRVSVEQFLAAVAAKPGLVGPDPRQYWQQANLLAIQQNGNSQREMLAMFAADLSSRYALDLRTCGSPTGPCFYLDDGLFTGNRILKDLSAWLPTVAGRAIDLHVVVMALHRGGRYYADNRIMQAASAVGVDLKITWWRAVEVEDRKSEINKSDVLRPCLLPADPSVQAHVQAMKYPPVLRTQPSTGEHGLFSSPQARDLLEGELLSKGVEILRKCPNLGQYQRPLGNSVLETLGFGALHVTHRNCANNAPLAFWVGYPWYPLFPRKTN
jgi:hypothetical protein